MSGEDRPQAFTGLAANHNLRDTVDSHVSTHEHARSMPDNSPDVRDVCDTPTMCDARGDVSKQASFRLPRIGINLDELRPEIAKLFRENRSLMDELIDMKTGGWGKPVETNPIMIWGRKHPDYLMIRSEVEINASMETVERYLRDPAFMAKVDVKREFERKIKDESSCCELVHYCLKGQWPISPRDMVTYRFYYYSDKDTLENLNFNAEDLNMPPIKGTVRADMKIQGGYLKRLGPHKTKSVVVAMINPKVAGIPMFIIRTRLTEAAMISFELKKAIEKAEAHNM